MTPGEMERRLRLLEDRQIVVVYAKCARCGSTEQDTLTTFLNRDDDGYKFTSLCKNSLLCSERA